MSFAYFEATFGASLDVEWSPNGGLFYFPSLQK